jgi:YD repeat-containing protein
MKEQSAVPSRNLWPFNHLQLTKTPVASVYFITGGHKMLKKNVIRDGKNRVIRSVTTGFAGGSSIVRDAEGRLLGKTSELFHNTRDAEGKLVSTNMADGGLLFGNDDE